MGIFGKINHLLHESIVFSPVVSLMDEAGEEDRVDASSSDWSVASGESCVRGFDGV